MTRYERALELKNKGLSSEAIAGRMGITIPRVHRLLHEARQKISANRVPVNQKESAEVT